METQDVNNSQIGGSQVLFPDSQSSIQSFGRENRCSLIKYLQYKVFSPLSYRVRTLRIMFLQHIFLYSLFCCTI